MVKAAEATGSRCRAGSHKTCYPSITCAAQMLVNAPAALPRSSRSLCMQALDSGLLYGIGVRCSAVYKEGEGAFYKQHVTWQSAHQV